MIDALSGVILLRLTVDESFSGQNNFDSGFGEAEQLYIRHSHVFGDLVLFVRIQLGEVDEIEERLDGTEKIVE